MKIGIITMVSDNYGNRLQNYALQETLKDLGVEIETFHNPFLMEYNELKHQIKKSIKKIIYIFVPNKKMEVVREERFNEFNKKYISWSKFWLNNKKHLSRISSEFHGVICGSDQVWNPESSNIDGRYFGTFMPRTRRYSYAASFGIDYIMEDRKQEWKEYIAGIQQISVREDVGVMLVKKMIGRDAYKHMDPTLLLDSDRWKKIRKKPDKINVDAPYILTYFLGTDAYDNIVNNYAERSHLNVIKLNDKEILSAYTCGPSEFIYLVENAKVIMTDSFHGTVFSILFKKPFAVFERKGLPNSMESRINSLLNMLGLMDCKVDLDRGDSICITKVDYGKVHDVINDERKRSISYLTNCISQLNDLNV